MSSPDRENAAKPEIFLGEAKRKSPLLSAFLSDEFPEFSQWERNVRFHTTPMVEEFTRMFTETWTFTTTPIMYQGVYNKVFNEEFYSESRVGELRLLGAELMFIGYQVEDINIIQEITSVVAGKLATKPYINPELGHTFELESYVLNALSTGVDIKIQSSDAEPSVIPEETSADPRLNVWRDFIDGLDLDGFTGK